MVLCGWRKKETGERTQKEEEKLVENQFVNTGKSDKQSVENETCQANTKAQSPLEGRENCNEKYDRNQE